MTNSGLGASVLAFAFIVSLLSSVQPVFCHILNQHRPQGCCSNFAGWPAKALIAFTTHGSVGYLRSRQASIPPSKGRTRVMPLRCSSNATRALLTSLGQEQ